MATDRTPKPAAAATLAEQICLEVQQRGLREGDVLTTEAELMERYGVSRSIVREAVSRLRALGILHTRQRKGLVVGRANPVAILRLAFPFTGTDPADLQRVAQMRYALELGAVDLAVRHGTPAQHERLATMAEEYAYAVRTEAPTLTMTFLDALFHGLILEMSGNDLLAGMHCVLEEHFRIWTEEHGRRNARLGPDERRRRGERSIWEHRMIADAFARRDAEQARAFLREHLREWNATADSSDEPA